MIRIILLDRMGGIVYHQRHGPSQPARPSTRNGEREDNDYYTGKYTLILYWRTRMYAHSLVLIKASLVCG